MGVGTGGEFGERGEGIERGSKWPSKCLSRRAVTRSRGP